MNRASVLALRVTGGIAALNLAALIGLAVVVSPPAMEPADARPPVTNCAPSSGMVWGSIDGTSDGGLTREYSLIIRTVQECAVRVDEDTFLRYTKTLGRTWP